LTEFTHTNRLAQQTSPYLLQHAHNPVDWFPWSGEAFRRAREENKPVFLSIGYSTCHWCHVMERESFEDEAVGELLNRHFISIKVDREERPDVDAIYMNVCQALTGSGGWPLTILMTPDKKPFYAGTYFPKETRGRYIGLIDMLNQVAALWKNERGRLIESANKIMQAVQNGAGGEHDAVHPSAVDGAFEELTLTFDESFGGFGSSPKFPMPHNLLFLMRYYKSTGKPRALYMAQHTLKAMFKGGIFDHVGYGFSRYSTDNRWLAPHFEKMLYDNALIALACTEVFAATDNAFYREIADKIFTYVLRDMTSPQGAFYSAEDADSEGVEGKFYLWKYTELEQLLSGRELELMRKYYGVTRSGNFDGANILNQIHIELDDPGYRQSRAELQNVLKKLYAAREKRSRPFKDDKILTGWNGLMIAALASAGRTFGDSQYIGAAKKAADFILSNMVNERGMLLSSFRAGSCASQAYLDDYAYFVWGLIELFSATQQASFLDSALKYSHIMLEEFWDDVHGGLFLYGKSHEELPARPKEHYDGATPSGNAVAAMNLHRLWQYTARNELGERAAQLMSHFSSVINNNPASHTYFLSAHLAMQNPGQQIILTGEPKLCDRAFWEINRKYLPYTTLLWRKEEPLDSFIPHLADYAQQNRQGFSAYVCENYACRAPVHDVESLLSQLQ